ncbi:MAG: LacI family DNA-binding transcriptional regulator [Micrococcales bacterium]|nr:LacI family DNA-binding transcriptional regulator [Micrococcales bacterium]
MTSSRQGEDAPTRRATLRDVAEEAGVSTSTASLVFSGKGPVAAETAERVRAAAAGLGYAGPNPLASSLRQGRSGVVGVSVEGPLRYAFSDPYAVAVLDGLADVLGGAGLGMLLLAQAPGDEAAAAAWTQHAVDALVFALCGPTDSPIVEAMAARGIPMIGTGAPLHPRVAQVTIDEHAASEELMAHLTGLGHTRIGHVTMPLSPTGTTGLRGPDEVEAAVYPDAWARARGFLAGGGDPGLIAEAAWTSVEDGSAAAGLLLDRPQRPTAIVAQSDLLAVGAVRAAEDRGLRVPQDLSVTGFDGVALPWFAQTLTTVVQPAADKGRRLGQLVCAAMDGQAVADEVMPTRLRVGSTTAPPPTP